MKAYRKINTYKDTLSKIYAGQASTVNEKAAFSYISDFPALLALQGRLQMKSLSQKLVTMNCLDAPSGVQDCFDYSYVLGCAHTTATVILHPHRLLMGLSPFIF